MENYFVIDTEGKEFITEIAIIDKNGKLIYEKFLDNDEDLKEIYNLLQNQNLIAHFATHDKEILERTFNKIDLKFEANFICTFELAKKLINIEKYSLEILSNYLNLQYKKKFFNSDLAHRASYDAIFTYKLYNKLLDIQNSFNQAKKFNPFSSSKVDNPFQEHFDFPKVYENEFNYLLQILEEIKQDSNHQTKSSIILGEAGSGKTHLMMRFVKHTSKTNRFLFIRHPNDETSVIFHIYSRILESFVQKISNSKYSQLEYLLAKSFSKIIIQNFQKNPNQTQKKVIEILKENHLNIYTKIGTTHRNWQVITKFMLEWWEKSYSNNEISINLLKGLIKFVQYKDKYKKEIIVKYLSGYELENEEIEKVGLKNWNKITKEEFSLEAISLFGKLSIFDEPMILCFDQLEALINNDILLKQFGESLKEIITHTPNSLIILNLFPEKWEYFLEFFDNSITDRLGNEIISLPKISKQEIKKILKEKANFYKINLDYIFTQKEYKIVTNYPSLRTNINYANHYFKHIIYKIPLPNIKANSLEEKFVEILKRVENLEKKLNISNKKEIKNESVSQYIQKVFEFKQNEYQNLTIIDDKYEKGKLKTILLEIKDIYNLELDFFKIRKVLPEHIIVKKDKLNYCIGFLNLNGISFSSRIKNITTLLIENETLLFRIFRDERENNLTQNSKKLIEKFNQKGRFIYVNNENQITFDTLHQIIQDYINKDINFELEEIMEIFISKFPKFWLCKFLEK